MLLSMMMYQCCSCCMIVVALMIMHCLAAHQSLPAEAPFTESMDAADVVPLGDMDHRRRLSDAMMMTHTGSFPSADDPNAMGEVINVDGDSELGAGEVKRKSGFEGGSSRNALNADELDETGKGYQMKLQRGTTLSGSPMSPMLSDSDNPLHTTDSEMNTNPSTQRSLRPHGSTLVVAVVTSTVPTSQTGASLQSDLQHGNLDDDQSSAEQPQSVPTAQHQHQQPQSEKVAPPSPQQRHRTINSMNLNPTTPAMVVKPVDEHRKLLKSTGPILNYVFDSHPPYYKSNYYNTRYGPHFETDNVTNITVQNGDDLFLSCRISLLQDKTVSWVRRKHGETDLQLLTVGKQTYSGDSRYTVEFQYPNNWRLKIASANKNDEGVYECQISTHPPKVLIYYLHVNAPEVLIVDEEGEPLYDKYYEVGSTIKLMCRIRHMSMLRSAVYWIHNENILNHDVQRGGISVKTNLTNIGANSTLFVAKVNKQDSGSYTCSIGPNQHYSVSVHVLNGTANPYGIYQRSCAFSALLKAVDLNFILKQLLFLMLQRLTR
ncbi:uncharacterized protein LOC110677949 isoform X2 [Aedes aegypti]|uniref:Ig-like domain-containing protein n=1 Tax=Aedes aegypti TaxID=7159 RepID=A0A6I8T8N7_AEDAE|nr:uncharacterized protein LOC110677949 isoform X2 [Aedes aegypti]